MSYHIIHILQHKCFLSVDRGFLVLKNDEGERRAPLSDILAVIVAAHGVGFSGDCLSEIIKNGGIILHCDENYRPIGKTSSLSSIVHSEIFQKQVESSPQFCDDLWSIVIKYKIENQASLLDMVGANHKLWDLVNSGKIDEGNCARHYWKNYFPNFGRKAPKERERQGAENPVNQMLNYVYAVMGAVCSRSILAHGLNPCLGIHHKFRFKAEPLLYDLMEPLRPFCDLMLLKFRIENPRNDIKEFIKSAAADFIHITLKTNGKKLKIINAVDRYVSSIADCFYSGFPKQLYIPKIREICNEKR
jgi:CRISPR-associated protein Cas1